MSDFDHWRAVKALPAISRWTLGLKKLNRQTSQTGQPGDLLSAAGRDVVELAASEEVCRNTSKRYRA